MSSTQGTSGGGSQVTLQEGEHQTGRVAPKHTGFEMSVKGDSSFAPGSAIDKSNASTNQASTDGALDSKPTMVDFASAPSHHHWAAEHMKLPREIAFVSLLSLAQLLTQAGLAISITPLHQIGDHFGITNPGTLSWFPAAYSLTVGTFILPAGRLGDLLGHRNLFIAGWIWYGIWSIVGGLSWYSNHVLFVWARVLQGIGPAILLPNSIAIIGRSYPPNSRRKEMVFALYGATAPNGFLVGAAFIGIFTQFTAKSWAWGYWVLGIVCFIAAILALWVIPVDEEDHPSNHRLDISQFDIPGSIVGVAALVLINFAWNQGPVVGWPKAYVYVCLILGFICAGLFFFIEARAPHPLVPVKRLNREIALVLASVAAGWASFGIWNYYLWQILQLLRNETPLLALAHFTPVSISGAAAAIMSGVLISRVRPPVILLASMVAFCVGSILIATMPVNQIYWAQTFVAVVIMPWGMDMSFPSANIIMSDFLPRELQGTAASLCNTAINYSISIALGMAGTIETQVNPTGENLLKGYRGALYFAIGCAGLGIAIALWMIVESKRMEKKRKTVLDDASAGSA